MSEIYEFVENIYKNLPEPFDGDIDDFFAEGLGANYLSDGIKNYLINSFGYKHIKYIEPEDDYGGKITGVFELDGKMLSVTWKNVSHYGWETCGASCTLREVKPVEKTITVYE